MKTGFFRWRMLALGASLAAAGACNGDSTEPARATTLAATSPVTQSAPAGAMVADAPSVRVTDQNGQPMPNVAVTFQVTGGGGTIAGGAATTNASGVASAAAWTLGSTLGPNIVSATVPGLAPVVFMAEAVDPCDVRTPITLGTSVSGVLSATDCQYDSGEFVDYLGVNFSTAQALSLGMTSSAFDAYLLMYTPNGTTLALTLPFNKPTFDARLNVYVPAGTYTVGATAGDVGAAGAYQVTASAFAENEDCGDYWVVPGVQITGRLEATDCDLGTYADAYRIIVQEGETLTIQMTSTEVDADLRQGNLVPGSNNNAGGGTNALYTLYAHRRGFFTIIAGSATPGEAGAYTLSVTSTGRAAAASELRSSEPRLLVPLIPTGR